MLISRRKLSRSIFATLLTFCFLAQLPVPVALSAGTVLDLPKPGALVSLSASYQPPLLRGLVVHPENPMRFDFIMDNGQERLDPKEQQQTAQRVINYFLASLAVPEKDMWVNLSPVEKDKIIPDELVKTELGRDLLFQDYMLKQISASLTNPKESLGGSFWQKIHEQAYQKYGVTQIPVDTFNKVWIVPQDASVIEGKNSVYVANMRLKVMLEDDYQAQKALGKAAVSPQQERSMKTVSKQVMREIIVPALEQEVNEGQHFAQLRQISYALTLAQWYQDMFKQSVINKLYAGQKKVAGIDNEDPKNKEAVYQQYLQAYKKGVYNFIKEETDRLSKTPIPRKYFSGGFAGQKIQRQKTAMSAGDAVGVREHYVVQVDMAMAESVQKEFQPMPYTKWNDLSHPYEIRRKLAGLFYKGQLNTTKWRELVKDYIQQVQSQVLYPVQSSWPVLKAIVLLSRNQEDQILQAIQSEYDLDEIKRRPRLIDAILLMNNKFNPKLWLKQQAPHLVGRMLYLTAAEIHHWAGGLGPVMKFLGKGMKALGAQVSYIEPWYQYRMDVRDIHGNPARLHLNELGLTDIEENFYTFKGVPIGVRPDADIPGLKKDSNNKVYVDIQVAKAKDENGVTVYLYKDILPDGSSYFTKMLYNYSDPRNNPVDKQQSMTFLNIAVATLHEYLETQRRAQQQEAWRPSVVHSNDGQLAPLQAVIMSKDGFNDNPATKDTFFAFTTHTYANRGRDDEGWGINVFVKVMLGVKDKFVNAFRRRDKQESFMDHTSGGVNLADVVFAVSDMHRDNVNPYNLKAEIVAGTNGADSEEMGKVFRKFFRELFPKADIERPTWFQVAKTKVAVKEYLNSLQIRSVTGRIIKIASSALTFVNARRGVREKDGAESTFDYQRIVDLVKSGANIILMNNFQGEEQSRKSWDHFKGIEEQIWRLKEEKPEEYLGTFYFVDKFPPLHKFTNLGAGDVQVQPSTPGTGANEFTEENIHDNGGLQAGTNEGVIAAGGLIPGQTFVPQYNNPPSWWDTVFKPIIDLWNADNEHKKFYEQCAVSLRLSRIMGFLNTAAANLESYDRVMERVEKNKSKDVEDINTIVTNVASEGKVVSERILVNGLDDGGSSFEFNIFNQPSSKAPNRGLTGLISEKRRLQEVFGYDAFLSHANNGHYKEYVLKLFSDLSVQKLVDAKFEEISNERVSEMERYKRLDRFIEDLTSALQKAQTTDPAMLKGGIDLSKRIYINKEGHFEAVDLENGSLENILQGLQGLKGNIISITPVANLRQTMM